LATPQYQGIASRICLFSSRKRRPLNLSQYLLHLLPRPTARGEIFGFHSWATERWGRGECPEPKKHRSIFYNFPPEISKNRSKKLISLSNTLSRFLLRSPLGEKRDTGGRTLAIAVPVVATLPLRNALRTNL